MATRWSSELMVAEHPDLQASAMTVDWSGTYVLLAGRRYLGVKNLTEPVECLKKFPRQSKYDVGAAEWNPHPENGEICAISTKEKVEIFELGSGGSPRLRCSLTGHSRVVSDLDWHQFDPQLLASCSIDTFTHLWDLREPRRPALSLSTVCGATQVRWNKQSRHLLATAHSGDIKLWDQRKGAQPLQYITAHLANIHCLDWDPNQENLLATSSQDCTVKFFDINNPKKPESVITAAAPVWRARYTPFGAGLLMVVVPPLRRGDNSILLWNLARRGGGGGGVQGGGQPPGRSTVPTSHQPPLAPVHTFLGHTDLVLEFEWRKRPDSLDYQLITWSKDQTLRIWQIEPFLQKLCGIENETDPSLDQHAPNDLLSSSSLVESSSLEGGGLPVAWAGGGASSRGGAPTSVGCLELLTSSESGGGALPPVTGLESGGDSSTPAPASLGNSPRSLHQEFSLINVNIHNVTFDAMDPVSRRCSVTARVGAVSVTLQIAFPLGYPNNTPPVFQFTSETSADMSLTSKLLKILKQTAQQRVKKNRSCLEPCIRQMIKTFEELCETDNSDKSGQFHSSLLQQTSVYSSFQDVYIPFPRTSGAKFCNVGMLVCFGRALSSRQVSLRSDKKTPRSFSALNAYSESPLTVPAYYYVDRHSGGQRASRLVRGGGGRAGGGGGLSARCGPVTGGVRPGKASIFVYDVSCLFPFQRDLAERYVLDSSDVVTMCERNAGVADSLGRPDLAQVWRLACLAACPSSLDLDLDFPWTSHPLSIGMLHSMISHYAGQSDVQTAAMLCCAFGRTIQSPESNLAKHSNKTVSISQPGGSCSLHKVESSMEGWSLRRSRSNSWSESLDDLHSAASIVEHAPFNTVIQKPNRVYLEEECLYEEYKKAYAEILHRWYLLEARAMVMKYISSPGEEREHSGLEVVGECWTCSRPSREPACSVCLSPVLQCIICHTSIRGGANACLRCGHVGHTQHMIDWFSFHSECPTGCGCVCLSSPHLDTS